MSQFVCPHCGTVSAIFKQGGGRQASERLGVPFLGEIPLDPQVCQTSDAGTPILLRHPESAVAQAFRRAAGLLVDRIRQETTAGPVIRMGL